MTMIWMRDTSLTLIIVLLMRVFHAYDDHEAFNLGIVIGLEG